jgi:hypothetical protein
MAARSLILEMGKSISDLANIRFIGLANVTGISEMKRLIGPLHQRAIAACDELPQIRQQMQCKCADIVRLRILESSYVPQLMVLQSRSCD